MELRPEVLNKIMIFQKNEITEHNIYRDLSASAKDAHNREVLSRISSEELKHYNIWKKYSGVDVAVDAFKRMKYLLIAKIFGITFAIKMMENGEAGAQKAYAAIPEVPDSSAILKDEIVHEKELTDMIDEEKLKYIGSIVLGLNDALVELTGTLAGLTFALQNSRIIGMAGMITGIAAALSMGASEYLSTKSEGGDRDPIKASFYTTIVYIVAVFFLVLPYYLFANYILCLFITILAAIAMIFFFTYYYSVVKCISFKERFVEMVSISLGVAALSFVIGLGVRLLLGVNI